MEFVKGFFITLSISLLFGLAGSVAGSSFFTWALITFISQYIIFFIISQILKTWAQVQVNRMRVERMNVIDRNKTEIRCATCGEVNEVEIDINGNNDFRCKRCNSLNKILVGITNVQKTEILHDTSKPLTLEDIEDIERKKNAKQR